MWRDAKGCKGNELEAPIENKTQTEVAAGKL
jgi:hypothetical protein